MDKGEKKKGQKRDRKSADSGLGAEDSPERRVRPRPSTSVLVPPVIPEENVEVLPQESEQDRIHRLISTYRVQEESDSDEEEPGEAGRLFKPPLRQSDPRQALADPEELGEHLRVLELPEEGQGEYRGAADVSFATAESLGSGRDSSETSQEVSTEQITPGRRSPNSSSTEISVESGMAEFNMDEFLAGIGGAIANAAQQGAAAAAAAHAAVPVHAGGAQLQALPIFNPEDRSAGTLTAKEWVRRVERLAQNFGWNQALLAASAKNKLGGSAATWLESQIVRGQEMLAWQGPVGFRTLFLARFDRARGALAAVEAISDLNQKPNQSVREFYDAVTLAVDLKHFNIDEADKLEPNYQVMRDNDIYILFQAGLKAKIKELATAGADPPETAETLLEAAVRIEVTLNDTKTHKVGEVKHDETGSSDEDDVQGKTPEEQIAALQRKLNKFTNPQSKLKCFEKDCQSTEHLVANCPIRRAKIQARNRGQAPRGGRGRGDDRGGRGGGWNWGPPGWGGWMNWGPRFGPPPGPRRPGPRPPRPQGYAPRYGGAPGYGYAPRYGGGRGYRAYEIQDEQQEYQGHEGYEATAEEVATHGEAEGGDYNYGDPGYADPTSGYGYGEEMYSGNA